MFYEGLGVKRRPRICQVVKAQQVHSGSRHQRKPVPRRYAPFHKSA